MASSGKQRCAKQSQERSRNTRDCPTAYRRRFCLRALAQDRSQQIRCLYLLVARSILSRNF